MRKNVCYACLLLFCGWAISVFTGDPQHVYAETRTSLGSLQAEIDAIISGTQTVGHANTADTALALRNQSTACGANGAGMIRFDGVHVQVCDGTSWRTLAYAD